MKSEMIFSGIGGQGTILMGKLVCTAAAAKGFNVTLAPASMIGLTTKRTDINVVKMPFTEIATKIGSAKSSNMVALGAVVRTLDVVSLDEVREVLKKKMKPELVDLNIQALEAGYFFTME